MVQRRLRDLWRRWAAAVPAMLIACPALAAEAPAAGAADGAGAGAAPVQYAQGWLGAVATERAWTLDDPDSGSRLVGELDTLPYGGGASQRLWGGRARDGFEGGGLITWKNDRIAFASDPGGLRVAIDNELLVLDFFLGGVLSLRPAGGLNLTLAAGPALAWGHVAGDGDDESAASSANGTTVFIDLDGSGNDLSLVPYARAGLGWEFANGFEVGVSARYAPHEFDFGHRGEVELDEVQWFLTLGQRL